MLANTWKISSVVVSNNYISSQYFTDMLVVWVLSTDVYHTTTSRGGKWYDTHPWSNPWPMQLNSELFPAFTLRLPLS